MSLRKKKNFLIVGAGALGQVLGAHLEAAGHDVTYLVKPAQRADLERLGIRILYRGLRRTIIIEKPRTLVDPKEVNRSGSGVILLCVRSDQMRSCLTTLQALPATWPILSFQPGFEDFTWLKKQLPNRPCVPGNPGVQAFFDGNKLYNRMHRLLPTLLGPSDQLAESAVKEIVVDFAQARIPCQFSKDISRRRDPYMAFGTAFLLGLQFHGFHLISLLNDYKTFRLTHLAAREAMGVLCIAQKIPPTLGQKILGKIPTLLLRIGLQLAIASPDAYAYRLWATHGPKISPQTRQMATYLCMAADQRSLRVANLKKLLQIVGPAEAPQLDQASSP